MAEATDGGGASISISPNGQNTVSDSDLVDIANSILEDGNVSEVEITFNDWTVKYMRRVMSDEEIKKFILPSYSPKGDDA